MKRLRPGNRHARVVGLASSLPVLLLSNSELYANLAKVIRRLSCRERSSNRTITGV